MSPKKLSESKYSKTTRLIHGKSSSTNWDYQDHIIPPLTRSTSFRLESAERGAAGFDIAGHQSDHGGDDTNIFVYDRLGEPNKFLLADVLATSEEAEVAVTFASGMAAVHAGVGFALNEQAKEIISHKTVYGCTYSLFTNWFKKVGIPVYFCDLTDSSAFLKYVNKNTRVLYLESPANPTLDLLDLIEISKLVKKVNENRKPEQKILTVIDNTFATPFAQRPIPMGIDVVVHSLTKGIGGFGTELGGAVITRKEFHTLLALFCKDYGGVMSASTAWNIHAYGIPTLSLRMSKQQASALKIAKFLESNPDIEFVRYPGLPSFPQYKLAQKMLLDYDGNFAPGFMIYFAIKGANPEASKERGRRMMNYIAENSYCITLAVSLGQLRTLIEHPGSMTHVSYSAEEQIKAGMHPGGIRLAVGIENVDDLIGDLDEAISASK